MRKLKLLVAMLSASLTTACANTTATEGTAVQICKQWTAIYPSRKDQLTDDTARQIAGNNAANEQWCGSEKKRIAEAKR